MEQPYFLSSENPVANVDQRDLEEIALRLLERPDIRKARETVTILWRNVMAYPAAEQMSAFDGMIDEYVFNFVLRAVSSDGGYPRVLRVMQPKHHWFGHDVPGSRWGGDSPDFTYRHIGIEHGGRYEVRARPTCAEPGTMTYTLMENLPTMRTLGIVDGLDLTLGEDGEYLITIDATPPDGRVNHLQTQPGQLHLLVRDALVDWLEQTPMELRVRRLDNPGRPPMSDDEFAQEAVRQMLGSLYYVYYCTQSGQGQPPNQVRAPLSAGAFGGMPTQMGVKGNLLLGDDEALIVTANSANAKFRNVTLGDIFHRSLNYWSRTGALNDRQMAPNEDGLFTYVVSHEDPGVHNWLDTGGCRRMLFGQRWQAFSRTEPNVMPTITTQLVKFSELDSALPKGIRPIDAAGRREQVARRLAGFNRRFIDQ